MLFISTFFVLNDPLTLEKKNGACCVICRYRRTVGFNMSDLKNITVVITERSAFKCAQFFKFKSETNEEEEKV